MLYVIYPIFFTTDRIRFFIVVSLVTFLEMYRGTDVRARF